MHLTRYLKPYMGVMAVSILLLFGQAYFQLALPDYLSDIVNVGIQQGGIEHPSPNAITEGEMNRVSLFMTPDNFSKVLEHYNLVYPNESEYNDLKEQYANITNESVYVMQSISSSDLDYLDHLLAEPIMTVFILEMAESNSSYIEKMQTSNSSIEINFSMIPPNMSLFDFLGAMPLSVRLNLRANLMSQFNALGDKFMLQASVRGTKQIYENMGADMQALQTRYIIKIGLVMLLFTLLSMLCTIMVSYFAAKVSTSVARDLRGDLYKNVENFSLNEFDQFNTSSLITRATNDIMQVQTVIFLIMRMVFYAPIMGIGGIIRALNKAPSMWWLIGVAVVTLLVIIVVIFWISLPKFKKMQKYIDQLNKTAREHLSGLMVVRAFNREQFIEDRFDLANERVTKTSFFVNKVMAALFPIMMLIMNGLTIGILWVGAHKVGSGIIQIGDVMAFMQYAMQIVFAFLMMSMMFIFIPRASVSLNRISELLSVKPSIVDPEVSKMGQVEGGKLKGEITFENVNFKYSGSEENVLSDINFKVEPGQTIGIIGPTGAGKSTLVKLIPRFYDLTSGSIKIDGIDIREITQEELRDNISYVPQKSGLFSGSIRENLLYANPNATEEQMIKAIEIAQASDFILNRPNKLDTIIGQGGLDLSGGQKQRLSIARALVKNAPIYIFDDSFSALDFKTDSKLRRELRKHMKDKTILIISQRIASIMNADHIIVLKDGKILGQGTHQELMKTCSVYKEIALTQNKEAEIA